jgi:hypothetical protein
LLAAFFNFAALALELLHFLPHGMNIGLGFHGFYWILIGYLIFKSTFLPRILGALMGDRGFALADLSATIVRKLSVPCNLDSALLVEGLIMLWLLLMTFPKWEEKASSLTNHA